MVKPEGIRNTFQPHVMHDEDLKMFRSRYAPNSIAAMIFEVSRYSVPTSRSVRYQYHYNNFKLELSQSESRGKHAEISISTS